MTTAEEWKKWRTDHLLNQFQMAVALGLGTKGGGRKTVQNIESGRSEPSLKTQRRFEALKARYKKAEELNAAFI